MFKLAKGGILKNLSDNFQKYNFSKCDLNYVGNNKK